jgi:hypothetical protein
MVLLHLRRFPRAPSALVGAVTLAGLTILAIGWPSPAAAEWKGTVTTREGVRQVINPAEPAEAPSDLLLRELWRLGEKVGDPESLGLVNAAFADREGNICLLDSESGELRIYGPAGRRVRTIQASVGTPGGLQLASDACLLPDGRFALLQPSPPRLELFRPDGTSAGLVTPELPDAPLPDSSRTMLSLLGVQASGPNLVLSCFRETWVPRERRLHRVQLLGLFGPAGDPIRSLWSAAEEVDLRRDALIRERGSVLYQGRWTAGPDGSVYAAPDLYGYQVDVLDPLGQLRMVIDREYRSLARTPQELDRVRVLFAAFAGGVPPDRVEVEPAHADIQNLQVMPDGALWVLSSWGRHRAPSGSLGVYDVFDPEGRFMRQAVLRGEGNPAEDGVWVLGDRVIVVRNLTAAAMARVGVGASDPSSAPPRVFVVCYAMPSSSGAAPGRR